MIKKLVFLLALTLVLIIAQPAQAQANVLFSNIPGQATPTATPSPKMLEVLGNDSYSGSTYSYGVALYLDQTTTIDSMQIAIDSSESSYHTFEAPNNMQIKKYDGNELNPFADAPNQAGILAAPRLDYVEDWQLYSFGVHQQLEPGYYLFSFDGRLLFLENAYVVINGTSSGILQHIKPADYEAFAQTNEMPAVPQNIISYSSSSVLYDSSNDANWQRQVREADYALFDSSYMDTSYSNIILVDDTVTLQDIVFTTNFTGEDLTDYQFVLDNSIAAPDEIYIEVSRHLSYDQLESVAIFPAAIYNSPEVDPFLYSKFGQVTGVTGINLELGRGVYTMRIIPQDAIVPLTSGYDMREFDCGLTGTYSGIFLPIGSTTAYERTIMIAGINDGSSMEEIEASIELFNSEYYLAQLRAEQALENYKPPTDADNATSPAAITLKVDGQVIPTDSPPIIQDGNTLAPVRALLETMGFELAWFENERRVDIIDPNYYPDGSDEIVMQFYIGKATAAVYESQSQSGLIDLELPVAAQIINGRTMIPVRFLAEHLGFIVDWDAATRTVLISGGPQG